MGFYEDMREAGIDPSTNSYDTDRLDIHKLAVIVDALHEKNVLFQDPGNPDFRGQELQMSLVPYRRDFDFGTVNHDWATRVADQILLIKNYLGDRTDLRNAEGYRQWETLYSEAADTAGKKYAGKIVSVLAPEVEGVKPTLQPMSSTAPVTGTVSADRGSKPQKLLSERMDPRFNQIALDLEAQGLLQPDGTPVNDPHALAPILFSVGKAFDKTWVGGNDDRAGRIADEIKELKKAYYEDKHIGADWAARTGKILEEAVLAGYETGKINAPQPAAYYQSCMKQARNEVAPELVVVDGVPSLAADLLALGLHAEKPKTETSLLVNEVSAAAPVLHALMETMSSVTGEAKGYGVKEMREILQIYENATPAYDKSLRQNAGLYIDNVWSVYRAMGEEQKKAFEQIYQTKRKEAEMLYPAGPVDVEKQKMKVDQIRDIQEKIKAESYGPHVNSREYKNMVAAVDRVAKLPYDPENPDSVRVMESALAKLNKAAEAYADKEAYKEKKTERGIDRRNTALSLLAITDPEGLEGAQRKVEEKARKAAGMKNEFFTPDRSKQTRKYKIRTRFENLVKQEQAATKDLAEKRRKERKAQKMDAPAKKTDGPEKR